jgi:NADPH:quinone reductase-like Zn-dependent oxidoreductase
MKAVVHQKYGPPDILELQGIEKPTVKDSEALIKLHAASAKSAPPVTPAPGACCLNAWR